MLSCPIDFPSQRLESRTIIKVIEIVYVGKPSRKECTIEMILYKYGLEDTYQLSIIQYTYASPMSITDNRGRVTCLSV